MQLDEETGEFSVKGQFDHPYPTTRILWIPDSVCVLLLTLSYHTSIYHHHHPYHKVLAGKPKL